ncbi:putative Uncharacterized protein family (UPF0183) [Blattamonas nauphoetae]|uniref:Uncharacterized protein n=1 Tax=Blattamonas nauphoetae TaxID=2049346 RepID=A0ABQ9Y600_9EUKA|nr:putative Uncharacterized protein family (UPF0183) [Blattamonas nauphoetae]
MSLFEVRQLIQSDSSFAHCDIVYSDPHPWSVPVVLSLRDEYIRFEFDPQMQILQKIVLTSLPSVTLAFDQCVFSGPNCITTMEIVYNTFPKTVLGLLNKDSNEYEIKYGNTSFFFHIPKEYHRLYEGMEFSIKDATGFSPLCKRIEMKLQDITPFLAPPIIAVPHVGIIIQWPINPHHGHSTVSQPNSGSSSQDHHHQCLNIGDSMEDVISILGAPERIYSCPKRLSTRDDGTKPQTIPVGHNRSVSPPALFPQSLTNTTLSSSPNQLPLSELLSSEIPSTSISLQSLEPTHTSAPRVAHPKLKVAHLPKNLPPSVDHSLPPFIYNYFQHGIDISFHPQTATVNRIILHTNIPAHPDFALYKQCPFIVRSETNQILFTHQSTLQNVKDIYKSLPPPIVNAKSADIHPFGPSFYYGFNDGIIFEVTKSEFLAAISVF